MAKTYSSKRVSVSFGGVVLTGFAKGSFITAARNADAFITDVGEDGEVSRSVSADESGTVKLVLKQTSESNKFLSDRLNSDVLTFAGAGQLSIEDTNGQTVIFAQEAWVRKQADVEFAGEVSAREWTFETGKLKISQGGTNNV